MAAKSCHLWAWRVGPGGLGERGVSKGAPVEEGMTGRGEDFLGSRRGRGETLRLRGGEDRGETRIFPRQLFEAE